MVFNPNIPQPGDELSDSQQDLLDNNTALDATFLINHFTFSNLTADNGKHRFVEMPVTAAIPAPLAASEGTVYVKTDTTPASASQLFYSPDTSGNEYQLTKAIAASFGTFALAGDGWTFLPGGLLLQYGTVATPGLSGAVTFPVAFPSTAAPYNIQLSLQRSSADRDFVIASAPAPTATGFTYLTSNASLNVKLYWMAIGK